MSITVDWDGAAAYRGAIARWPVVARARVQAAVHDTASDMAVSIAGAAPVDTGFLSDSISVDHELDSDPGSWGAATVYTNTVYARRINFGFHGADSLGRVYNQPADPFWDTGFNQAAAGFESRVRAALLS